MMVATRPLAMLSVATMLAALPAIASAQGPRSSGRLIGDSPLAAPSLSSMVATERSVLRLGSPSLGLGAQHTAPSRDRGFSDPTTRLGVPAGSERRLEAAPVYRAAPSRLRITPGMDAIGYSAAPQMLRIDPPRLNLFQAQ